MSWQNRPCLEVSRACQDVFNFRDRGDPNSMPIISPLPRTSRSGSELKLATGQTVKLAEGAIVGLDPNSSVRVIGNLKIDMPQPSKQQLQLDTTSSSDELPFTNYTIFRSVSYGAGEVVTGWDFDLSDTTRPKIQFCYYTQSMDKGLAAKYTIAVNDSPKRPSTLEKLSFNFEGALLNCIWFSGA
jgi:hypothetical protein